MMFTLANSSVFDFFEPIANVIISIAGIFWKNGSAAVSQIGTFVTGILLIVAIFLFSQFLMQRFHKLVVLFNDMKFDYLKAEERRINKELHNNIQKMNKKITTCLIYIELRVKENISEKINLEEQYEMLNKYLASKLNAAPVKYKQGYVYRFSNIDTIDSRLCFFFNALHSQAPVDYLFIFQVIEGTYESALFEVDKLRNAGIYNKILMTPATNLRYENNIKKDYTTGVVGNYVFSGESHSIYELKEKFF